MDTLDRKIVKNDIDKMNSVFLVKKFTHDLPYIRSKLFFSNLKRNADDKTKYENLSKDLEDGYNDIKNQNKIKLLNKILKIYAYKKIEGLVNACNDYDKKILVPKYGKEFLQKLFLNMTNKSQYNYENRMDSKNKPKTTKLQFKKKVLKNDKKEEQKKYYEEKNLELKRNTEKRIKEMEDEKNKKIKQIEEKYDKLYKELESIKNQEQFIQFLNKYKNA